MASQEREWQQLRLHSRDGRQLMGAEQSRSLLRRDSDLKLLSSEKRIVKPTVRYHFEQ